MKNVLLGTYVILMSVFFACSKEDDPKTKTILTVEDFTVTIDENPENGYLLGTIEATTTGNVITFDLISESVSGAIQIDSETGDLYVLDKSYFDFELNHTLTAEIEVKSDDATENVLVTIDLSDKGYFRFGGDKYDLEQANLYYLYDWEGIERQYYISDGVYSGEGDRYNLSSYTSGTYLIEFDFTSATGQFEAGVYELQLILNFIDFKYWDGEVTTSISGGMDDGELMQYSVVNEVLYLQNCGNSCLGYSFSLDFMGQVDATHIIIIAPEF